jgi:PKD domain/CARDB
MTRNRISSLLFSVLALLFVARPAAAFNYWWDCRGGVTWESSNVTFRPELKSFPVNTPWHASIDAARIAWNNHTPGSNYTIHYNWVESAYTNNSDGINSILIPTAAQWTAAQPDTDWIAVALGRRSMCYVWPGPRADIKEMDILFNPNVTWEPATNPQPPHYGWPYNLTRTAVHEHGHAMALDHEQDLVTRMNSQYPFGGVISSRNDPHPFGDDARGARSAYGTAATARDTAGFVYRSIGSGYVREILPPSGVVHRNTYQTFSFAIDNRGSTDETIRIHFYLTPNRSTPVGYPIGAAQVSLQNGRQIVGQVSLRIPPEAPTGFQYFSWVTDPFNTIYEVDEGNNGVAHIYSTQIVQNRAPEACYERDPIVGTAPMNVNFDASCTIEYDGDPLTYTWDFGDGTAGSGVTAEHEYTRAGYYNITLTVTDPSGASNSVMQTILVQSAPCTSGRATCLEEEV